MKLMETTLEKPFKCHTCPQSFTNEDHLQVHLKRHDMSLNLCNINGTNTGLNQPEGFTDQTPTPTRFYEITDDVGLFQEIQNVNPFDEQFAKAASATISNEHHTFGFPFSSSHNNDSLNTPQVLGFPHTPNPLNQNQTPYDNRKKKGKVFDVSTENTEAGSEINGEESQTDTNGEQSSTHHDQSPQSELGTETNPDNSIAKRTELLERNRAAACRSRERRKQWISELELKNRQLINSLAKAQSELRQIRAENISLKEELSRHSNCGITSRIQILTPKSPPTPVSHFHPSILRSPGGTIITTPSISSLSQPTITKPKRGRPKKGQEKRPSLIMSSTLAPAPPLKVQIIHPSVIVINKSKTGTTS